MKTIINLLLGLVGAWVALVGMFWYLDAYSKRLIPYLADWPVWFALPTLIIAAFAPIAAVIVVAFKIVSKA